MRTICVIVDMFKAYFEIERIENNFPCFVNKNRIDNTYAEVEIKCRQEDAKSIEDLLARFV